MHIITITKNRWPQFKQELLPIAYVCIVQTWWHFYSPPFIKIKSFSPLLGIILTTLSYLFCISAFIFPEKYAASFTLKHLDHAPAADSLKMMHRTIRTTVVIICMFLLWYSDIWGMPNTFYAILYAHSAIAYLLMARAVKKYTNKTT